MERYRHRSFFCFGHDARVARNVQEIRHFPYLFPLTGLSHAVSVTCPVPSVIVRPGIIQGPSCQEREIILVGIFFSEAFRFRVDRVSGYFFGIGAGAGCDGQVLVYQDMEKYQRSLLLLGLFGVLLLGTAVLSMRRMRYESI